MKAKGLFAVAVALPVIMLCGCGEKSNLPDNIYWTPTSYSLSEIQEKYCRYKFDDERELEAKDITAEAVEKYNILLGYVETILNKDYYVYDFYYVYWVDPPSWVIKVVPEDIVERELNAEEVTNFYSDDILMLSYNEDGSIESGIEPYYMAERYIGDLKNEFAEKYPDYGVEMSYSVLYEYYPVITEERIEDIDDYTCVINDSFYDNRDEWSYDNEINIIVPPGTPQEEAYNIYLETEPVLKKYCVTEVNICAPVDENARNQWAEEEYTHSNVHLYDDNADWVETFYIQQNNISAD